MKKNPKLDLENYKGLFLQAGLVLSLLAIFIFMEWKTYEDIEYNSFGDDGAVELEEDDVPITEIQKKPPPPPPPPPPAPKEILKVVEDDVEIEEVEIASSEMDEEEEIEFEDFEEVEEEVAMNFMVVENKPVFPGCEDQADEKAKYMCFQKSIHKHIAKNFEYPEIAMEMEIQGNVVISFTIAKTGAITDIQILRGVDKSLDQEAQRLIKLLPKMIPAKQRGRPVPVKYTIPVRFKLQF